VHPDRTLFIDASLPNRLASELVKRGRIAVAASELSAHRLEDPELLDWLAERFAGLSWVLVTGDDAMPAEHGEQLERLRFTVATVDGRWEPLVRDGISTQDHWNHEVVHRWAHVMALQQPETIKRYSRDTYRRWTRRRR
jgi:hypothetical protein